MPDGHAPVAAPAQWRLRLSRSKLHLQFGYSGGIGLMGWKDIFMKRRLPDQSDSRFSFAGAEDRLRRAATAAVSRFLEQGGDRAMSGDQRPFAAGYLVGFVSCLAPSANATEAAAALASELPDARAIDFALHHHAGFLVGRHEAQCGSAKLFRQMTACLTGGISPDAFLTSCDNEADRLQTRQPAVNYRFTASERAAIVSGLQQVSGAA
jgi:hypothetical protein